MKRIVAVIVATVVIGGGLWWYYGIVRTSPADSGISASGFIEATDVSVATEVAGRIVEISADEGDQVKAGVPLIRLDDSLLKAQQRQAEANVQIARAYLEQATASRDGAKKAWEDALALQRNPQELNTRIVAAQGALDMAQLNLERIGGTYEPSSPGYYGWNYRTALLQRDTAKNALDVLLAIRDNPLEINAAVDQAYAAYQTAIAAVKTAERQVEQAEASLQVIIVQLGKLTASSPISGIVADRFAEPGEIAQPGIPVLKIIELSEVTLTAYVPESKIGLVKLGQTAVITVDSYPGQDFAGKVIHISSQAQFTPKNIQMKEEREKTVFAVKIELPNPEQKLKPGMPADARILTAAP